MKYTLKITTLSDTLIGSALSYGTIIDNDIVFDSNGLPYIPAKRIKGLFRNAAVDLLAADGLKDLFQIDSAIVKDYYGNIGSNQVAPEIVFQNLHLEQHIDIDLWMEYLSSRYEYVVNNPLVRNFFTEIRTQTAIDPDTKTAKDHSLRSSRVLKKGFNFCGEIHVPTEKDAIETLLGLSCLFVDRIGSKRNRGFGRVKLDLLDESGQSVCERLKEKLEASCNN